MKELEKRMKKRDNLVVSAVIAVIVMVVITVVLAGVLYVWVMGMANTDESGGSGAYYDSSPSGSKSTNWV